MGKRQIRMIPENLKATFFFGVASFLTSGINYIVTPVFTRMMSTSEYGVISIYNALYMVVSAVATLTLIKPGLLNVGMYDYKENRWQYLSSMLGLVTISSICTGVIVIFMWITVGVNISLPFSLIVLMILSSWLSPAMTFWTYKQRYEYKYKSTFVITMLTAMIAQVFSVFSVYIARKRQVEHLAVVRLWSAACVNLTVSAILAIYILVKGKKLINASLWKKTLIFAIPLIPHYLGFAFLNSTDKLMIGNMVGKDKAGIYSLASVLSTVGILLWQALCVTVTPFVNEKLGSREFEKIDREIKPLLILIGGICLIVVLLAPEAIWVLGAERYREGIYVVPATVAGVFLHIIYDVFAHVSFFHKKSVQIMTATVTAAFANVVLNYVFIQMFGYVAASYTTLFSFFILSVMHYRNVVKIEPKRIFDIRYIVFLAAIVCILCILCTFLYNFRFIRILLAVLIGSCLLIKSRMFITAISDMRI